MKERKNTNYNLNEFEKRVMKHMSEFGYSFPTNEAELEKFNEIFGNTSFELPQHLQDSSFIVDRCTKVISMDCNSRSTVSIAARDGNFADISDELLKELECDFDNKLKQ